MADLGVDFLEFLAALAARWWALVPGFILVFIGVYEGLTATRISRWRFKSALLLGFFMACFLAWRQEHAVAESLKPRKPGVEIEHYDTLLRPDQDWYLRVRDRNNPDYRFTVELLHGDLHVRIENQNGRDRSALERRVRIECSD